MKKGDSGEKYCIFLQRVVVEPLNSQITRIGPDWAGPVRSCTLALLQKKPEHGEADWLLIVSALFTKLSVPVKAPMG